jgi:hypothetical protein
MFSLYLHNVELTQFNVSVLTVPFLQFYSYFNATVSNYCYIALNFTSGFHKMLGSSRVAAQLAASQEALSSMSE